MVLRGGEFEEVAHAISQQFGRITRQRAKQIYDVAIDRYRQHLAAEEARREAGLNDRDASLVFWGGREGVPLTRENAHSMGAALNEDIFGKGANAPDPEQEATRAKMEATQRDDRPMSEKLLVSVDESIFFRDFGDAKEATRSVIENVISILLRKKKLVLAFHSGIRGNESGRLRAVLQRLEALKNNSDFKEVLKGLVIIPSFSSAEDLNAKLAAEGVDPKDAVHNAVFTFCERGTLDTAKVDPAVKSVFIQEKDGFNGALHYYPLFEIVAITLIKAKQGYSVDEVKAAVKRLGIKFGEINIDIDALTDKLGPAAGEDAFLVFSLMPNAERFKVGERRERYVLICEYIASAA
jgi:hypothetical protein